MKDAFDQNKDDQWVFGFVTTGVDWQLVAYHAEKGIKISNKLILLFAGMQYRRNEWINNNSNIIDVIYKILVATEPCK